MLLCECFTSIKHNGETQKIRANVKKEKQSKLRMLKVSFYGGAQKGKLGSFVFCLLSCGWLYNLMKFLIIVHGMGLEASSNCIYMYIYAHSHRHWNVLNVFKSGRYPEMNVAR